MKLRDLNTYTLSIIGDVKSNSNNFNENYYQRKNKKPLLHYASEEFYLAIIKTLNSFILRRIVNYFPSIRKKYNGAIARANRELQRRDYIIETYSEILESKYNYPEKIIDNEGQIGRAHV